MKSFFLTVFGYSFFCCRRHKLFTAFLIVSIIIAIILGIVGGIQINHSMFPQNFSNVPYIKYLKGSTGFAGFLFSLLFTILIFIFIVYLCGCKKWLLGLGVLFFLYFVYAQVVTIVSIMLEFGFFNTIIIVLFLIITSLLFFFLFVLTINICLDCCNSPNYFSVTLKLLFPILVCFFLVIITNVVFTMTLRNFVIVLVYD